MGQRSRELKRGYLGWTNLRPATAPGVSLAGQVSSVAFRNESVDRAQGELESRRPIVGCVKGRQIPAIGRGISDEMRVPAALCGASVHCVGWREKTLRRKKIYATQSRRVSPAV
jgi:hypothetical protein